MTVLHKPPARPLNQARRKQVQEDPFTKTGVACSNQHELEETGAEFIVTTTRLE
jgi:hypothetical protein